MATNKIKLKDSLQNVLHPETETDCVKVSNPVSGGGGNFLETKVLNNENYIGVSSHKATDFAPAYPNAGSTIDDGKILEKDSNEVGGVKWVQKPVDGTDGKSAYELAIQQGYAGSLDDWLASLKAQIGAFKFVDSDPDAVTALTTYGLTYSSAISGISPLESTLSVILLMNDNDTTPTKTMMIATQDNGSGGYQFVYINDLENALPSNTLTQEDIVDDLTTGGVTKPLSAEQGKILYENLLIYQRIEISGESKAMIIDQNNKWILSGSSSSKSIIIPIQPNHDYRVSRNTNSQASTIQIAILNSPNYGSNNTSVTTFASGFNSRISITTSQNITTPNDGTYMYIRTVSGDGYDMTPIVELYEGLVKESVEHLSEEVGSLSTEVESIKDSVIEKVPFNLSDYTEVSGRIDTGNSWYDNGTCWLMPVGDNEGIKEGDVFYMKAAEYAIYYAFLSAAPENGTVISTSDSLGRHTITDSSSLTKVIVPQGTIYFYIMDTATSSTSHKPAEILISTGKEGKSNYELLNGTFNSSYNETIVDSKRLQFCSLINGKNTIESFLFFTDPHLSPYNAHETMTDTVRNTYISMLQKYYNSLPLDFCICGGDWINYDHTPSEACSWLGYHDAYMRKLFRNYYPIFGNHDNNPYSDGSGQTSGFLKALDYTTMKNLMFRENKETYYSFDGVSTKVYVLNTGVSFIKTMTNSTYPQLVNNRWTQIDWLANKLLSDDADNSMITFHIYSNASLPSDWFSEATGLWAKGIHEFGANVKAMSIAYNNKSSITLNNITYDFSQCNGHVMFLLVGHTHFDYIDTSGEIPVICTTSLQGAYIDGGTKKYTLEATFDCCMNDIDNSRLHMVRVGVGKNRIVNYTCVNITSGSTQQLTSQLTGTITWQTRDGSIASVSNGVVTALSSGYVGIIASDTLNNEEYWIIKVS